MTADLSKQLADQVTQACASMSSLRVVAGNSKAFYGNPVNGQLLDISGHTGVINYEPTELVITVRAGTRLSEVERLLQENGQQLPFEPPAFTDTATIGGTIACNLSGPARAYTGAARDYLLGCKIINGKGEVLSFGGEVMKNVAGYDVSRLMAGSMGTLGVLLEVSLKVLPRAETEVTLQLGCAPKVALEYLHVWAKNPIPITASSYHDNKLNVRLSGATNAVMASAQIIGGDTIDESAAYWHKLKEQQLGFFKTDTPLWRLSVASDTAPAELETVLGLDSNHILYEWGGALRWVSGNINAEQARQAAMKAGGHSTLFMNNGQPGLPGTFQPLPPALLQIHRNLKQAFDPNGILNPGKLYPEL